MASKPTKIIRPFASWFALVYFAAVAVYCFSFVFLYDPYCLPLHVQGSLAGASALGVFMMKRWSLWVSAISLPVISVIELSTLSFSIGVIGLNPNWNVLMTNASYLVMVVLAVFACLFLMDKRRDFK